MSKVKSENKQTSFDFGQASGGHAVILAAHSALEKKDANLMHVDTSDSASVQLFLQRVAIGRFGDLMVSFNDAEPQLVKDCLVNLNNPDVTHNFIKAIDHEKNESVGETIKFATPLIFITHRVSKTFDDTQDDVTHFKAFRTAALGEEPISIGASLMGCPTHRAVDGVNFSSVVLVDEVQLTKEAPKIPQDPFYYHLGLNALQEQRETVIAVTRDSVRAKAAQPTELPPHQVRMI